MLNFVKCFKEMIKETMEEQDFLNNHPEYYKKNMSDYELCQLIKIQK